MCWNYVYLGIQSQSGYLFLGLCFSVMTKSTRRIRVWSCWACNLTHRRYSSVIEGERGCRERVLMESDRAIGCWVIYFSSSTRTELSLMLFPTHTGSFCCSCLVLILSCTCYHLAGLLYFRSYHLILLPRLLGFILFYFGTSYFNT